MTKFILSYITAIILISGGLLYLFRSRFQSVLKQLKREQPPLTLPTAVTSDE